MDPVKQTGPTSFEMGPVSEAALFEPDPSRSVRVLLGNPPLHVKGRPDPCLFPFFIALLKSPSEVLCNALYYPFCPLSS